MILGMGVDVHASVNVGQWIVVVELEVEAYYDFASSCFSNTKHATIEGVRREELPSFVISYRRENLRLWAGGSGVSRWIRRVSVE
jgi:hypothetical protein